MYPENTDPIEVVAQKETSGSNSASDKTPGKRGAREKKRHVSDVVITIIALIIVVVCVVCVFCRVSRELTADQAWEEGRQLAEDTFGRFWDYEVTAPADPDPDDPDAEPSRRTTAHIYIDTQTGVQYLCKSSPAAPMTPLLDEDGKPLVYDFSNFAAVLEELQAEEDEELDTPAARRRAKQEEKMSLAGDTTQSA